MESRKLKHTKLVVAAIPVPSVPKSATGTLYGESVGLVFRFDNGRHPDFVIPWDHIKDIHINKGVRNAAEGLAWMVYGLPISALTIGIVDMQQRYVYVDYYEERLGNRVIIGFDVGLMANGPAQRLVNDIYEAKGYFRQQLKDAIMPQSR